MNRVVRTAWWGQPKGLTILFLTNMWEQFSYYGMRALLVYYMTKELMIGQASASLVYGAYTATAYFTPVIGGVIADRWLGKRAAVITGGTIMALGHFMMVFEPLFYVALACIALGNGLFLPSLPSQINDLYDRDDPRRAWGYNVYYVGINIGGFLAPLVCGSLGEIYGWHYGFGAAGIGMVIGLTIYILGGRHLPDVPARQPAERAPGPGSGRRVWLVLLAIGIAATVFRGAYEQVGNTVALWADTGVDRAFLGFPIPPSWFQALNPLLVILMTPPLLAWWRRRAAKGHAHGDAQRMALGAVFVGGAYLLLAGASATAGPALVGWPWLALFFAILTFGELYILPTGLSLFARLAPARFGATSVAAWYCAIFTGSLFAGALGTLWSWLDRPAFFLMLAAVSLLAGLMLRLLDAPIRAAIDAAPTTARPPIRGIDP